jgi:hypothetical protein
LSKSPLERYIIPTPLPQKTTTIPGGRTIKESPVTIENHDTHGIYLFIYLFLKSFRYGILSNNPKKKREKRNIYIAFF